MMQHAAQGQRLFITESREFECLLPSPLPSYFRSHQLHVCPGLVTESFCYGHVRICLPVDYLQTTEVRPEFRVYQTSLMLCMQILNLSLVGELL